MTCLVLIREKNSYLFVLYCYAPPKTSNIKQDRLTTYFLSLADKVSIFVTLRG